MKTKQTHTKINNKISNFQSTNKKKIEFLFIKKKKKEEIKIVQNDNGTRAFTIINTDDHNVNSFCV